MRALNLLKVEVSLILKTLDLQIVVMAKHVNLYLFSLSKLHICYNKNYILCAKYMEPSF
jgi:hypothetical protein